MGSYQERQGRIIRLRCQLVDLFDREMMEKGVYEDQTADCLLLFHPLQSEKNEGGGS
jgi:hypothetical protein